MNRTQRFRVISAVVLSASSAAGCAQLVHDGSCVADPETFQLPACATQFHRGTLYVKPAFARAVRRFEPYQRSYTHLEGQEGWAYFDRSGKVLVQHVATMDNGADNARHGTVRVSVGGKWGLATLYGRPLTPLLYDGIVYAEHGYSACTGCHNVQEAEHSYFAGGMWTELGYSGKPLPGRRKP